MARAIRRMRKRRIDSNNFGLDIPYTLAILNFGGICIASSGATIRTIFHIIIDRPSVRGSGCMRINVVWTECSHKDHEISSHML